MPSEQASRKRTGPVSRVVLVVLVVLAGLATTACSKESSPGPAEHVERKGALPLFPAGADGASCAKACAHLRALAIAELDRTTATLTPAMAAKLRAHADASAESDQTHCEQECEGGKMFPACVLKLASVDALATCRPARPEPPAGSASKAEAAKAAEAAITATLASCDPFRDAAADAKSCDELAAALDQVSAAMPGVPNHHDAPAVDDCIDLALDLQKDRCKDSRAYRVAATTLMRVIMSLK